MLHNRGFIFIGVIAFAAAACTQHAAQTQLLPQTNGLTAVHATYSQDASAPSVTFKEFPLPSGHIGPIHITSAPKKEHVLWFTEFDSNSLGLITTKGKIFEHPLIERAALSGTAPVGLRIAHNGALTSQRVPIPMVTVPPDGNAAYAITVGADQNIWFDDEVKGANEVGRIKAHNIVEYPVDAPCCMQNLAPGPNGALWFPVSNDYDNSCTGSNYIGTITTGGAVSLYTLPSETCPFNVTTGPNKKLWFTEYASNSVGEMTTSGKLIRTFKLPSGSGPDDITLGPDKALWFTECVSNHIGRLSVAGKLKQYKLPKYTYPEGITVGPDGALWFLEEGSNALGRITTKGKISSYPIPTSDSAPFFVTLGPDGALWFTEYKANKIGRAEVNN
jgi:virginiamycin B lyase